MADEPVVGEPSGDPRDVLDGPGAVESRAGRPWSAEEDHRLVDELRSGTAVDVLAERHGRTAGAITSRLARMIPPSENVRGEAAANWLRERFPTEDYPWQEVLGRRTAARRNGRRGARIARDKRESRPGRSGRADIADHDAEHVLDIWQEIVAATLTEPRRSAFIERVEIAELGRYPDELLIAAGQDVFDRRGELLLGDWATQCARTTLDVPAVGWSQVVAAYEVAAAVRRIVDAAVAGLSSERRRLILAHRLGLDGTPPLTLQSIGDLLGLSRERVRQIQEKALTGLRRGHGSEPAKRLIADIRHGAEAAGISQAQTLLTLANLGLPGADLRLAVTTLAILAGDSRDDAVHLAAEAAAVPTTARSAGSSNSTDGPHDGEPTINPEAPDHPPADADELGR